MCTTRICRTFLLLRDQLNTNIDIVFHVCNKLFLWKASCWILCDQCSRQAILLWWVLIEIMFVLTDLEMGTVLLDLCKLLLLQQFQYWVPDSELSKWWNLQASCILGNYLWGNVAILMLQKPTFPKISSWLVGYCIHHHHHPVKSKNQLLNKEFMLLNSCSNPIKP